MVAVERWFSLHSVATEDPTAFARCSPRGSGSWSLSTTSLLLVLHYAILT